MNFARVRVIFIVFMLKFFHKFFWRYVAKTNGYIVYKTFIPFYFISSEIVLNIAKIIINKIYAHSFCDIGSGCGYIGIEIVKQYKTIYGIAIDFDEIAAIVTKINAKKSSVFDRIDVVQCFSAHCLRSNSLDVAVSNPPYLPCPSQWFAASCSENDERIYIDIVVQLIRITKKIVVISASNLTNSIKFLIKFIKNIEIYRKDTGLDKIKVYLLSTR